MKVRLTQHHDGWGYRVVVDGRGMSDRGYRFKLSAYIAAWSAGRRLERLHKAAPVPPRLPARAVCYDDMCSICEDRRRVARGEEAQPW